MFIGLILGDLLQSYGHVYHDGSITQTSILNSLSMLEACDGHFPLCVHAAENDHSDECESISLPSLVLLLSICVYHITIYSFLHA